MTEIQPPTPEDMERNLAVDLKECAKLLRPGHGWAIAIRRAIAAEAEVQRLQGIVNSLAARCAGQSEALSRRANKS